MQTVLDSDIIGTLGDALRERGNAALEQFRENFEQRISRNPTFVITPDTIKDLGRAPDRIRPALIEAAKFLCEGILTRDSGEIMLTEPTDQNPYATAMDASLKPIRALDDLRELLGALEVQQFFHEQRLDYDVLRGLMGPIAPGMGNATPADLPSFAEYVEENQIRALKAVFDNAVQQGHLRRSPYRNEQDLERIWRRSFAYQMVIRHIYANEYRLLRREHRANVAGSMTDLRQVIESSYADALVTRDVQLFYCGRYVNQVRLTPRFIHLTEVMGQPLP